MAYEEVNLGDMSLSLDAGTATFTWECPCGDRFEITLEELLDGEEIAGCPSCSLVVIVLYSEKELSAAAARVREAAAAGGSVPPAGREVGPIAV